MFAIPMDMFSAFILAAYSLSPLVEGFRLGWHKPPRPYLETECDFNDPRTPVHDSDDLTGPAPPEAYRIDHAGEDASLAPYILAYFLATLLAKPEDPNRHWRLTWYRLFRHPLGCPYRKPGVTIP